MALQPFQHHKPEQQEQSAQPQKPAQHHQSPQFDPDGEVGTTLAHSMTPKPFKEPKEGREYKEPKTPQHYQTPQSPAPVLSFAYDGLDGSGNEQWRLIITLEGDYASVIDPDTCKYRIIRLLGNGPDGLFDVIIDTPGEFAFLSSVDEDFASQVTVVEGRTGWLDSAQRSATRPSLGPDATNLAYRLRGDDAASDLSTWPADVGSNPTITGTPAKNAAALNGHASVGTNGSDNYITIPVSITEPMTFLAVAKFGSGSRGFAFQVSRSWGGFAGGGNWGFYNAGGVVDLGVDSHAWGLLSITMHSPTDYDIRVNGVNLVAGISPVSTANDALQLGADGFGGSLGACEFADFLVFDTDISDSVREAWEDEMGTLYGITVTH